MRSTSASTCFKSAPRAPGRCAAGGIFHVNARRNGISVSHTYDAGSRETVQANTSAAGGSLAVFTRTFDAVSNPLTVLELDGTVVSYGYDATYQLTLEQRSGANAYNTSYGYDPVGNRLQKSDSGAVTTGVYDAADQQTSIVPPTGAPTTQSWDGSGNLALSNTGGALTAYSWDGENRLATLQNPGAVASTYLYSSDTGYRQVANAPSGYTRYLWDEQNVLTEQDASRNLIAAYTNDPGNWGGLASQRRSGTSTFYGYDQQGSARILAAASGSVTDNYSFKAFGEELQSGSGTVNPYRYVGAFGYYRDGADWMYVRARWLEAQSGRWVSVDPIRQDELSAYRYAGNGPVQNVDPGGSVYGACTVSPSLCPALLPDPPCVGITNGYAGDCKKTGDALSCCASCVSALICDFIRTCEVPVTALCLLAPQLQCVNICMYRQYQQKNSQPWKDAKKRCKSCGQNTQECCQAEVNAEQSAFTSCAPGCGFVGALIPQWVRILFALDVVGCCKGLPQSKLPGCVPK